MPNTTSDFNPTEQETQPIERAARLKHVCTFFDGVQVLHDISLEIPAHGITVLVGRSGSGKTTLLRTFNRLNECLPGCRTRGSIHVSLKGQFMDVHGPAFRDAARLRIHIGMVFQTPDVLPVSIRRNIELPLRHALGLPQADIDERLQQALRESGLWEEVSERLHAPAETLSGGQQQRLCLARSLAMHPSLLLLDEPTASLDSVSARTIEALLQTLRRRYPVVMVSHSLGQALRLADRLVLMNNGRIQHIWNRQDGLPDAPTLETMLEDDTCCT